jgi:hypothetical protein
MAIFSLNHSFIGRSTHASGSASLFARYITSDEACTETISARTAYRPGAKGATLLRPSVPFHRRMLEPFT